MTTWQRIETAPEDKIILLSCVGWEPAKQRKEPWPIKVGYFWSTNRTWKVFGASWRPTHWAELPTPPETDPAMPVFVSERSLDIPGRGTVHVGRYPEGCEGVRTYVMVDGKPRKIREIDHVNNLRPGDQVGLVFYAESSE